MNTHKCTMCRCMHEHRCTTACAQLQQLAGMQFDSRCYLCHRIIPSFFFLPPYLFHSSPSPSRLSLSLSLSFFPSPSPFPSLAPPHSLPLSLSLSLSRSLSLAPPRSLPLTLAPPHSRSPSLSPSTSPSLFLSILRHDTELTFSFLRTLIPFSFSIMLYDIHSSSNVSPTAS